MYARASSHHQHHSRQPPHRPSRTAAATTTNNNTIHASASLPAIHHRSPVTLPHVSSTAARQGNTRPWLSPDPVRPPAMHLVNTHKIHAANTANNNNKYNEYDNIEGDAIPTPLPTNTNTTTPNTTTYTTPSTRPITRLTRPEAQAEGNTSTRAGNNMNNNTTSTSVRSEPRYIAMLPTDSPQNTTLTTANTTVNNTISHTHSRVSKKKAVYRRGRCPGLLICQTASAEDIALAPRLQLYCYRHVKFTTPLVDEFTGSNIAAVTPPRPPSSALVNTTHYSNTSAPTSVRPAQQQQGVSRDAAVQTEYTNEEEEGMVVNVERGIRPTSRNGVVYTTVVPSPPSLAQQQQGFDEAAWMTTPLSESPAHIFTPTPPTSLPAANELKRYNTRPVRHMAHTQHRPASGPVTTTTKTQRVRNVQEEKARVESEPPHMQQSYRRSTVPIAQHTRNEVAAVESYNDAHETVQSMTIDSESSDEEVVLVEDREGAWLPNSPLPRDPQLTSHVNAEQTVTTTTTHAEPVSPQSEADVDPLMKQHSFEIISPRVNVMAPHNKYTHRESHSRSDSLSTIETTQWTSAEVRLVTQASVYLGNTFVHPLSRTATMTCIEEKASVKEMETSSTDSHEVQIPILPVEEHEKMQEEETASPQINSCSSSEDDEEVRFATPLQQAMREARAALRVQRTQPITKSLSAEPTPLAELQQLMRTLRPAKTLHGSLSTDDVPPSSTLSERGFVQLCATLWLGRFPALYTVEELVLQWRQLWDQAADTEDCTRMKKGKTSEDVPNSAGKGHRRAEFADELHTLWAHCVQDYIANPQQGITTTTATTTESDEEEETNTDSSSSSSSSEEAECNAGVLETLTPFTDPGNDSNINTTDNVVSKEGKEDTVLELVPTTSSTLLPSSAVALGPHRDSSVNEGTSNAIVQAENTPQQQEEESEEDSIVALPLCDFHDEDSLRCCPVTLWQRPLCSRSLSEQLVHLVLTLLVTNHDQYAGVTVSKDTASEQEQEEIKKCESLPTALTRLLSQEPQTQLRCNEPASLTARATWRLFLGVPQWSGGYGASALHTLAALGDGYVRQWCAILIRDFIACAKHACMRGGLGSFIDPILRNELPQAALDDCGCMLEKLRYVLCATDTADNTFNNSSNIESVTEEYEVMLPSSDFVQAWHCVRHVWPQSTNSDVHPTTTDTRQSNDEENETRPSLLTLARRLRHFFAHKAPARLRVVYSSLLYDVWRYAHLLTINNNTGKQRQCDVPARTTAVLCWAFVQEGAAWLQAAVTSAHVTEMVNADATHTMGELLQLEMSETFIKQCFTTAQTFLARDDAQLPCGAYNSELLEVARLQYATETLEQTRRLQVCICNVRSTAANSEIGPKEVKDEKGGKVKGRGTVHDVLRALCALESHVPLPDMQEYVRHLLVLYYSQHTLDGLPVVAGSTDEAERMHARVVAEELSLQDWFAPTDTLQDYRNIMMTTTTGEMNGAPVLSLSEVAWVNVRELAALCPRVLYRPRRCANV